MAINTAGLATTADRLVAENGRALVLKRSTAVAVADYDPVTGAAAVGAPPVAPVLFNIRAVVGNITTGFTMRRGVENVQARDRLLTLGPTVTPRVEDVISFDGEDWQVVHVEEVAPNGTPIMYTVQVRP